MQSIPLLMNMTETERDLIQEIHLYDKRSAVFSALVPAARRGRWVKRWFIINFLLKRHHFNNYLNVIPFLFTGNKTQQKIRKEFNIMYNSFQVIYFLIIINMEFFSLA